jgi:hypothetical protein
LVILLSLIIAWVAGIFRHRLDITVFLKQALPSAIHFDPISDDMYVGLVSAEPRGEKVGFVAVRSAQGYAGPVTVAAGLDLKGHLTGAAIVRQTESSAFFKRILDKGYPRRFTGKSCSDEFEIANDVDAVTGATVSLEALTEAVHLVCSDIARDQLGLPFVVKDSPVIRFGLPEVVLVLVFLVGFVAYSGRLSITRCLKWFTLVSSLVLIGFVLKRPISLVDINSLLVGYWPRWQIDIYWYLLLAGVLLPVIVKGTSPYCSNVCPFGATQQILVTLGGSRVEIPPKYSHCLKLVQWTLAWAAVMCALLLRNPSFMTYEVSATFFTVIGRNWQFILLGVALILSLFVTRPWCNYLCPVRAVADYIRLLRRCFKRQRAL